MKKHLDYIPWNPVKHGLSNGAGAYKFSSFNDFVLQGIYPENWGEGGEPISVKNVNIE